ncbi:MAG: hypothetical protein JJT96_04920 [Opitutales bacterium]|nr:hypothetical protein [Opitutales bacterium]
MTWALNGNAVTWSAGADARFEGVGGLVRLSGALRAGTLSFANNQTVLLMNHNSGDRLSIEQATGQPTFRFEGVVPAQANNYPAFASQLERGLTLTPQAPVELNARLEAFLGGSPFLIIRGEASDVTFNGTWVADTGSIISWLMPLEGATFRIGADADMRFIKDDYYTLQLWVQGDGTGTLEIEEGFQADRTAGAQQSLGIGSIRLSNTTFITHHTRNLPLGYRPKSSEALQANGHLAFENNPGSRWIVRSNDQVYPGAVWIYRGMEVRTEANLTHTGVTEAASDYTAFNGWSVFGGVVRKTGPARLILAGEQSYDAGSLFFVEEGGVEFVTDPSAGRHFRDGTTRTGTLMLEIEPGAEATFRTSAHIDYIFNFGRLMLSGPIRLGGADGAWFGEDSVTEIVLTAQEVPWITADWAALLDGRVRLWRDPAFAPVPGTRIDLLVADSSLSGSWELDDLTGLGLTLHADGSSVWVETSQAATDAPGDVLLDDDFADLGRWHDLSTVPLWGQPQRQRSAFTTEGGAVHLVREGSDSTVGFTGYAAADGLKTFTALDFRFPDAIDRAGAVITLDARMRWGATTSSSGEAGRFIFAFNHSYPAGGLDLTPEGSPGTRLNDFSEEWWARPAYHLRIRNGTTGAGSAFLQYGGGPTDLGEYEREDNWWLPGFISGAGGVAPGAGLDFPANSWTRTPVGIARDAFTLYRYVIYPDRQEVWRDDNGNGLFEPDELKAVMPLPMESTAPFYRYFETIEGLRLFWNGGSEGANPETGQVYIDHLRLTVNTNQPAEITLHLPEILQITNGVEGAIRLDASGTIDPEGDALLFQWFVDGVPVGSTTSPVTAARLTVGERTVTLRVIDAFGNVSMEERAVTVTPGNLRPIARAGGDRNVTANERLLAGVTLDASQSIDPDGEIVRYEWYRQPGSRLLSGGPSPRIELALPVGLHVFELRVIDNEGAMGTDTARIQVSTPASSTPVVIYRENFSRPQTGGERGPWDVGWDLMRFDGEPVPSVKWDGNAHRSLSTNVSAIYLPKVNADPTGTEYDSPNARGHMWMNQMPALNVSPAEWMLWTEEYTIDRTTYEIHSVQFHATDKSPERVKNSLAVRIDGEWYIFWDGRVESLQTSWWRLYTINFATGGWYRFEPSPTFSILRAEPITLPPGDVDAFGLYFYKDYAWYVNEIDNFTVFVTERVAPPPFLVWQTQNFRGLDLLDDLLESSIWGQSAAPGRNSVPNLIAYATGQRPFTARHPQPTLDEAGDIRFRLPLNPAAEDVELIIRHTADFSEWRTFEGENWTLLEPSDGQLPEIWDLHLPGEVDGRPAFYRLDWVQRVP